MPPSILAHRGARHAWPDNSMAAFTAAVDEGADGVECDVQMTRDGIAVLRHDLFFSDGQSVGDLDVADVRRREPAIVRLDDLLAWRRGLGRPFVLLVELKDPEEAAEVARLLAGEPPEETWLGGFHGPALATARSAVPALITSLMVGSVVGAEDLIHLAHRHGCTGVHPCWEARARSPADLLPAAAVETVRSAGLFLTLWHEEREAQLQRLVALGVDAICTDTPGRLRAIIDGHDRPTG